MKHIRDYRKTMFMIEKEWEGLKGILEGVLDISEEEPDPGQWIRAGRLLQGFCLRESGLACETCQGYGQRSVDDHSLNPGGIGFGIPVLTTCDSCWGTGVTYETGYNQRESMQALRAAKKEASARWVMARLGATKRFAVKYFPMMATKLRRVRWASGDFWYQQTITAMADALDDLVSEAEVQEQPPLPDS